MGHIKKKKNPCSAILTAKNKIWKVGNVIHNMYLHFSFSSNLHSGQIKVQKMKQKLKDAISAIM